MNIKDWPRPAGDTGIGVTASVTQKSIDRWLPEMKEMGIKWVVLGNDSQELIGRAAARYRQEGLMPIARPHRKINRKQAWYQLALTCNSPYIILYNEPEDPREWAGEKRREDYWHYFLDKWFHGADAVIAAGCNPGLQVTSPGDLEAFLWAVDDPAIWDKMWLALHCYLGQDVAGVTHISPAHEAVAPAP